MFCGTLKKDKRPKETVVYYYRDGEPALERRSRGDPAGEGGDTGPPRARAYTADNHGTTFVELTKNNTSGLGLVITGGIDKDKRATISHLRPGGVAQRSDQLQVGDFIQSVNGIRTSMLRHDEIVSLLLNAGDTVVLEIEYELPEPPQNTFSVLCKRLEVELVEPSVGGEGTLGFTLRGGMQTDPEKCRPLTITQIRQGGPCDREGSMKIGDRILAMNNYNVTQCTLQEAISTLQHKQQQGVNLLIEYDVSVMDAVQNACGPLLVEIDKTPGSSLGISLGTTHYKGHSVICIHSITPASIADRCGALHIGDHILGIDDTSVEHLSVIEATQLLKCAAAEHIKLEILPVTQLRGSKTATISSISSSRGGSHMNNGLFPPPPRSLLRQPQTSGNNGGGPPGVNSSFSSLQSHATYASMATQMGSAYNSPCPTPTGQSRSGASSRHGWTSRRKYSTTSTLAGGGSSTSGSLLFPAHQLCHVEVNEVELVAPGGGGGSHRSVGITLAGGGYAADTLIDPPHIAQIDPRSPAERCGVLQEGDRVLAINGQLLENKTLEEANRMLKNSAKVTLLVEVDVAESVIPSSGVFNVKLAKRGSGLGITITAPKERQPGEPLLISDVRRGSVAHRTGTIHPGDRLLAINTTRLESCSLEDAAQVLHDATHIVKLKIQKDDLFSEDIDPSRAVTYTVELKRHGGPLGITISGTEEPFDPIFISGLTEGGLAEKTGALHMGDRILAINGTTLRQRPLSEAISMLQDSGHVVTLKISRPLQPNHSGSNTANSTATRPPHKHGLSGKSHDVSPRSVDSALESWDSSGLENNNLHSKSKGKLTDSGQEGSGSSHTSHEESETAASTTKPRLSQPSSAGHPASYNDISGEIRINGTKWRPMNNHSTSVTPILSPASSQDQDEWSKQIDELDQLGPLNHQSGDDRFSPPMGGTTNKAAASRNNRIRSPPTCVSPTQLSEQSGLQVVNGNLSDFDDDDDDDIDNESVSAARIRSSSPYSSSDLNKRQQQQQNRLSKGAELHLREVEEEMQQIFTPTPVELLRVTLSRWHRGEDFGFSLSDGVYEKGVYISAVRPGGPADRVGLRQYDRILQIHNVHTKEQECRDVIPIISKAGQSIDMVLSRNPLAEDAFTAQRQRHGAERASRDMDNGTGDMWEGRMDGLAEETV